METEAFNLNKGHKVAMKILKLSPQASFFVILWQSLENLSFCVTQIWMSTVSFFGGSVPLISLSTTPRSIFSFLLVWNRNNCPCLAADVADLQKLKSSLIAGGVESMLYLNSNVAMPFEVYKQHWGHWHEFRSLVACGVLKDSCSSSVVYDEQQTLSKNINSSHQIQS